MTPRNRLAHRMLGLGALLCLLAALVGIVMTAWSAGSGFPREAVRDGVTAVMALGVAILAYGRRRQLR